MFGIKDAMSLVSGKSWWEQKGILVKASHQRGTRTSDQNRGPSVSASFFTH